MTDTTSSQNNVLRTVIIGGLLLAAFFGAYRFASARGGQATPVAQKAQAASAPGGQNAATGSSGGSGSASAAGGCSCCGGGATGATTSSGVTGAPVEGTAKLAGGVQVISVNVTTTYSPNVIKLKAGTPAEITFSQAAGCTSQVVSQELGFSEDLSAGPRTVKLAALKKGTYAFSCGMGMVFGKIVVE